MFKQLIAVTAALVCMTGPQAPAHAADWDYCKSMHGGVRICADAGVNNDVVAIADPQRGYVRFGVKCTLLPQSKYGWEWEVFEASENNSFSKQSVDDFANEFCQGRLGVEATEDQPKYTMA